MLSKLKIFLIFFFALLFFAKPILATCNPDKFSQFDAYEPSFDICGTSTDVNGKEVNDCCNTDPSVTNPPAPIPSGKVCPGTGVRCWPSYRGKSEPGCKPGFITIDKPGEGSCDTCCLKAAPRCSGAGCVQLGQDCDWGTPPDFWEWKSGCDKLKKYARVKDPKTYCEPPDWHYIKSVNLCYAVAPSGWSKNITSCPSASGSPYEGVQTAIGCIPTSDLVLTAGFFLKWAFGAVGGVMLVMLIVTGYSFMTSGGNPEKLQAVKENLVSILSGLILLGFSLVLLKAVGADILGLPGF